MGQPPSAAAGGEHHAPGHTNNPSIVLVCTDDIARSVGRDGLLEGRLAATTGAAPLAVVREPGAPLSIVLQRLAAAGRAPDVGVPEGLETWFATAFTTHIADPGVALLVVSVAEDWLGGVWRHHSGEFFVNPPLESMTGEQRAWLEAEFTPLDPPSLDDIEADLHRLIQHADSMGAHVLVHNVSTFTPDEKVFALAGFDGEPLALRANRIDFLLETLAGALGFSVVDVDRIVAELGAGEHVRAAADYSPAACAACAEEAAAAIVELPALHPFFGTDVMRVRVPRYDKRAVAGRIVKWHRSAPAVVERGDPLFDVRFDNLAHTADARQRTADKQRSLLMSVLAATDGHLQSIVRTEGSTVEVGTTVAVVGATPDAVAADLEQTASFPVGIKVATR